MAGAMDKIRSWLTGVDRTKPSTGLRSAPVNQPQPELLGDGMAANAGKKVKKRTSIIDQAVDRMVK
jgi:hypothetical protein